MRHSKIKSVMSRTSWQKKTQDWEVGIKRLIRRGGIDTFIVYVHINSALRHAPSSYATYDNIEAINVYRALVRIMSAPLRSLGGTAFDGSRV